MANKILPPSAERIARETGGAVKDAYDNFGLTCYREEKTLPSGNTIVEEGWIESKEMPNGKRISIIHKTKTVSRETAENER